MARGHRDYEKAVVAVESEGYQDLHGRILVNDTFEDTPFKWVGVGNGTHFETRQQRAAYNGSLGAELEITSDAPPAQRLSQIGRLFPVDVTQRLMTELFWQADVIAPMDFFTVNIIRYAETGREDAGIRYNRAAQYWEYYDATPAWVELPGSHQTIYGTAWNELSLSADFATNEYISFKSNDLEINMGGIPARTLGPFLGAHAEIWITAENSTANRLRIAIDDVVVKELEV